MNTWLIFFSDVAMTDAIEASTSSMAMADHAPFDFNSVQFPASVVPSILQFSEENMLQQVDELNNVANPSFESMDIDTFDVPFTDLIPQHWNFQAQEFPFGSVQGHEVPHPQVSAPCKLTTIPKVSLSSSCFTHADQMLNFLYSDDTSGETLSRDPNVPEIDPLSHALHSQTSAVPSAFMEQPCAHECIVSENPMMASGQTKLGLLPNGPIVQIKDALPPYRQGKQTGRMTKEQAQQQYLARLNGVCIRCWWGRRKVTYCCSLVDHGYLQLFS